MFIFSFTVSLFVWLLTRYWFYSFLHFVYLFVAYLFVVPSFYSFVLFFHGFLVDLFRFT